MPKISSSVEPEMPGSTIAQIAIAPQTKTYRNVPTFGCVRLMFAPSPEEVR